MSGRAGARLHLRCPDVAIGAGREMYGMELYAAVRLAVVEEGSSHSEVGRRFGIDRWTVTNMLNQSAPPGCRLRMPVRRQKLDGFTGIIDRARKCRRIRTTFSRSKVWSRTMTSALPG